MITFLDGFPDNVLAFSASGRVTGEDYSQILIPALEDKLSRHSRIRLLYELGPEFTRFTVTAFWDDAKLGMHHLHDFERVAVVTDIGWVRHMVKGLRPLADCELRLFSFDERDQAYAWIRSAADKS
ncbi:MAG TPA: STAS/SEC14 domain-containing protein [Chromatiales bacterium]|nr:STAS/SEC14 domain-containing protein [Chromatiales bacterium]